MMTEVNAELIEIMYQTLEDWSHNSVATYYRCCYYLQIFPDDCLLLIWKIGALSCMDSWNRIEFLSIEKKKMIDLFDLLEKQISDGLKKDVNFYTDRLKGFQQMLVGSSAEATTNAKIGEPPRWFVEIVDAYDVYRLLDQSVKKNHKLRQDKISGAYVMSLGTIPEPPTDNPCLDACFGVDDDCRENGCWYGPRKEYETLPMIKLNGVSIGILDLGSAEAQYRMGFVYKAHGDDVLAMTMFKKAAKQGHLSARQILGKKDEIVVSDQIPTRLMTTSVRSNGVNPVADSFEVHHDDTDEKKFLVEDINPVDSVNLDLMSSSPKSTEKNHETLKFQQYLYNSQLDRVNDQVQLAKCYLHGHGVEQNLDMARFWLKCAIVNGSNDAVLLLASLIK